MMIGFPILMYYLWICLWFYDGQLVYPSSLDDVQPFLHRMWAHVRDVSTLKFVLDLRLTHIGREPESIRMARLFRFLFLSTLPCFHTPWLSARGSSSPLSRVQDPYVQLQCSGLLLCHYNHCGRLSYQRNFPPHRDHR